MTQPTPERDAGPSVELITAEHAALECPVCRCSGEITVQLPAHPGDIEPRERTVKCEFCRDGYLEEVECHECGEEYAPVDKRCGVVRFKGRVWLICPDCCRAIRREAVAKMMLEALIKCQRHLACNAITEELAELYAEVRAAIAAATEGE